MDTYTIWMGYDPREDLAYRVARHSILSRSEPRCVQVLPIDLANPVVAGMMKRPIERKDGRLWCPISQAPMATEFAISRFCTFFLPGSKWSLFVDSDIVCTCDIRAMWKELDDKYAVMCVKHQQQVKEGETKMDGQLQTFYARKNWSSVMAVNRNHPANKLFTLKDLNERPGRDLHAFFWLKDDEIGELDHKWNHLVGVDEPQAGIETMIFGGVLHFTMGGKWFPNWNSDKQIACDKLWEQERDAMVSACKSTTQESYASR